MLRLFQGVGAAMLMANSAAVLTDAFPRARRGMAMGINQAAAMSGTFIGLVLGGILAPINWRLVFLVSVPIGLFATVWGYLKLRELSQRRPARIDWPGNVTFAAGLILVMIGITYGIEPYRADTMGWTNPLVISRSWRAAWRCSSRSAFIETRVAEPMFRIQLFRIRAFTAGVLASFLAALSRGGLMFMLIIWLQGIWLPLHGYDFARTPLWAGLAMLPLDRRVPGLGAAVGHLVGPVRRPAVRHRRHDRDRGRVRPARAAAGRLPLLAVRRPAVLHRDRDGVVRLAEPGAVMNSVPAEHRGAGSGMNTTFQNSAQVLSIGIFFSLMIVGLSSSLPAASTRGWSRTGCRRPPRCGCRTCRRCRRCSRRSWATTRCSTCRARGAVPSAAAQQATLTGRSFFPTLITAPFKAGLRATFDFAIVA